MFFSKQVAVDSFTLEFFQTRLDQSTTKNEAGNDLIRFLALLAISLTNPNYFSSKKMLF
jgi:hypothetical protein